MGRQRQGEGSGDPKKCTKSQISSYRERSEESTTANKKEKKGVLRRFGDSKARKSEDERLARRTAVIEERLEELQESIHLDHSSYMTAPGIAEEIGQFLAKVSDRFEPAASTVVKGEDQIAGGAALSEEEDG